MRQAVIILLIIVFSLSTVGMYIAAGGSPAPRQQQSDVRSEQNARQNSDLPAYLRTGDPNIRQTVDATGQSNVTVTIGNSYFNPTVLRISRGTTVAWRNQGNGGVTVTSERGSPRSGLDSGTLESNGTYRYTFDEPGIYNYYSQSDSTAMRAVIEVKR